ncbi:hypothetical protein CDAR_118231 [Caerostris darwini]|uniref:Uncharacterized protein n=1 Tax=Caerostris darwini TaxID=1538125 RepID=A0AAV4NYW0_9ARAC|nr:hypothetical protein CDAR_118231 [Caerostris darwini]
MDEKNTNLRHLERHPQSREIGCLETLHYAASNLFCSNREMKATLVEDCVKDFEASKIFVCSTLAMTSKHESPNVR